MARLPNGAWAVIDEAKLTGYCLNPDHERGGDKARVFASALGITTENAEVLHLALREAARTGDVRPTRQTEYGQLYALDFEMTTVVGRAIVRSRWIVRHNEDFPRLTSCFVR